MSPRDRMGLKEVSLVQGAFIRSFGLAAAGVIALAALDLAFPPPIAQPVSAVVLDRDGRTLRAFPLEDGRWRLAADLDRLEPKFLAALLAMEDQRFLTHHGVDVSATARAAIDSARAGRIVSGASTITMQTARLLEPRPRTLGSKLVEMVRAAQIERRLSKREILELYLTLAPYGGNLEGVRAASWAYFGREPEWLTPGEIALLIALPQSPEARRPDRRPDRAIAARNRVLDRLARADQITPSRAEEAKDAPAPARGAFPALAWHASDEVRRQAARSPRRAGDLRSTLDRGLQTQLEELARAAAVAAGADVQVSMLVVEIDRRAVRASVGSAGRDRAGGWLDLTDRARSPGSTLKPLIYGLAFDDGRATPATRIADLPRRFASYQPENFDRSFRGDVTITEALQHSLNVPAVQALDAVGADRFAAALRFAGAEPRWAHQADASPGLALALGGVGLTAREIALLYAALGDEGRASPLTWLDEAPAEGSGYPLLSPQASADILDILRGAPSPAGRAPAVLTQGAPEIAFKTGTSYGYRDAWAAGVAEGYAAVVWVGRADGAPRPGVTGREGALPLLFDVFDRVALSARGGAAPGRSRIGPAAPAPRPLADFERAGDAPVILFPPENAALWAEDFGADARGFVLAGRGEGRLEWYVDGAPAGRDAAGAPIWRPAAPGFYAVAAIDGAGRSTQVQVRVIGPSG